MRSQVCLPGNRLDRRRRIERLPAGPRVVERGLGIVRIEPVGHHMWAMSCSTRSSTERNGSLHNTVRWAWSFSFRWTQSTV
jgi:hypothetical protein